MQHKPGFGVVSFVLTLLVLAGFFTTIVKKYIPPGKLNSLQNTGDAFLEQARFQPVQWKRTYHDATEAAALSGKPILLVIGGPEDVDAQFLDQLVFSDSSLAAWINRSVVPLRVDALEHPDWQNAFLPLSRLQMPNFSVTQVWLLSSRGDILAYMPVPKSTAGNEREIFVSVLSEALRRTGEAPSYVDALSAKQASDRLAWTSEKPGMSISEFSQELHQLIDPEVGGIPRESVHRLWPNVWEFFILLGRPQYSSYSLNALILSPQNDLYSGGFFTQTRDRNRREVVVSKGVVENGAVLHSLLMAHLVLHDPMYEVAASDTLKWLVQSIEENDLAVAWKISQANPRGRSLEYSYSLGDLANSLSSSQRQIAVSVLNLDPRTNPAMIPYISNRKVYLENRDDYRGVLEKLRAGSKPKGDWVGRRLSNVNFSVMAKCLEAMRLMPNSVIEAKIRDKFERLPNFLNHGEIVRRLDVLDQSASLHSWLDYSDAMLEHYLLTGDSRSFETGLEYLAKAKTIFKSDTKGLLQTDRVGALPLRLAGSPEIVDGQDTSAMAKAIKLYRSFSILAKDRKEGTWLIQSLSDSLERCGYLAREAAPELAGLFSARLIGLSQGYGVAVGPQATEQATIAKRLRPVHLWFPAIGTVRPDLQKQAPGVYWVSGDSVQGPLTLQQILDQVPSALNPTPASNP